MALLELCQHLELLTNKLTAVGSEESYRVGRIWQNLRLDLPCIRDPHSGIFLDNRSYPDKYPPLRGPNVPSLREEIFQQKVGAEMPELNKIAARANSNDFLKVIVAAETYFKKLEDLSFSEGNLTADQSCNSDNYAQPASLPPQLCRYLSLKTFIRYTLLPNVPASNRWTKVAIDSFINELAKEVKQPGPRWRELATIWKETRKKIRNENLSIWIKPRYSRGDVNFVGDGGEPIHRSSPHPLNSKEALLHVIRELALPGWEDLNDRINNLGLVAVEIPSVGLRVYRPTMLDNFSSFSYFFLPGNQSHRAGLTWRLTDCLRFNSHVDHGGQPEWTAVITQQGIPCMFEKNDRPVPAFEIAGLSFDGEYASLFNE